MKILIELPTWLGDAVMTTPAIENIVAQNPRTEITLFGSFVSTVALSKHPAVKKVVVDDSREKGFRILNFKRIAKKLGKFDIAISFRRTLTSKIFLFFIQAKKKFNYKRYDKKTSKHQVIRYNDFINKVFHSKNKAKNLKLHYTPKIFTKPTLGINPGANYGSAKRWYPSEFAKVAKELSNRYDIIIFGGKNELEMAKDVENKLKNLEVTNYENLAGKTSVDELITHIGGLSLFVTNDSGPMHISASFQIPTVAIFGPTNHIETNQWQNPNGVIAKKEMECAPCMKRICPLKHHDCMKLITSKSVLKLIKKMELI